MKATPGHLFLRVSVFGEKIFLHGIDLIEGLFFGNYCASARAPKLALERMKLLFLDNVIEVISKNVSKYFF